MLMTSSGLYSCRTQTKANIHRHYGPELLQRIQKGPPRVHLSWTSALVKDAR